MRRRRSFVLALVLLGCGRSQPSAPSAAPDCPTVAAHLVELSERDNGATASASLATGMQDELTRTCTDDRWSAERRKCLLSASNEDATLACPSE